MVRRQPQQNLAGKKTVWRHHAQLRRKTDVPGVHDAPPLRDTSHPTPSNLTPPHFTACPSYLKATEACGTSKKSIRYSGLAFQLPCFPAALLSSCPLLRVALIVHTQDAVIALRIPMLLTSSLLTLTNSDPRQPAAEQASLFNLGFRTPSTHPLAKCRWSKISCATPIGLLSTLLQLGHSRTRFCAGTCIGYGSFRARRGSQHQQQA